MYDYCRMQVWTNEAYELNYPEEFVDFTLLTNIDKEYVKYPSFAITLLFLIQPTNRHSRKAKDNR